MLPKEDSDETDSLGDSVRDVRFEVADVGGVPSVRLRGRRPRVGGEEAEERSKARVDEEEGGVARVRGRRPRVDGVVATGVVGAAGIEGGVAGASASTGREGEGADRGKLNVLNLCVSSKGAGAVEVGGKPCSDARGVEGSERGGVAVKGGLDPNEKVFILSAPSRRGGDARVEDRARGEDVKGG